MSGSISAAGDARAFGPGDRVRLLRMEDPFRRAPIGAEGTVTAVCPPPVNVVSVRWDDGFGLNPCLDVDVIQLLDEEGTGGAHG